MVHIVLAIRVREYSNLAALGNYITVFKSCNCDAGFSVAYIFL